jgi:hypothetical protein
MFDASRHETRQGAAGRGYPLFSSRLTSLRNASERSDVDTVAKGEKVEAELDTFIARRHDKRVKEEGERAAEEAWAERLVTTSCGGGCGRSPAGYSQAAPPPPRSPYVRHVLHSAGLPDLVTDR